MAEVKHFDNAFIFPDPIINKNGAMLQFSHAGTLSDSSTYTGKPGKQIHMVEQSGAKTHGCLAIVFCNVADDFSEVG